MYLVVDESGRKSNINKNQTENIVMYSAVKTLDKVLSFNNFSIKYVTKGEETYTINNQKFDIQKNDYLLCNHHCEGKIIIDSAKIVEGICIDISPNIMSEVLASYKTPDTNIPDLNLGNYFNSNDFMEQKFNSANTNLGEKLHKLYNNIEKDPYSNYQFDLDFFYFLTESIISDYIPIVKQFNSVRSVKSATKKDLIRRLEKGKKYIDENFQRDIEIINVANEAHISQYHFFRLFRNVYNISPLQYIKQKKMEKAKGLIHKMPINQIANEVGYNDIFSFSKAYKKHFGYAPSETLK